MLKTHFRSWYCMRKSSKSNTQKAYLQLKINQLIITIEIKQQRCSLINLIQFDRLNHPK